MVIATLGVNTSTMIDHYPGYKDLANYANEMNKVSPNIRKESIIFSINWSDHWMLGHLPDYLGVDKPVIFTSNYEVELKWFPLVYKKGISPQLLINDKLLPDGIWWASNAHRTTVRKIDYVFLFGKTGMLNDSQFHELKDIITRNYVVIYSNDNQTCVLYAQKPAIIKP